MAVDFIAKITLLAKIADDLVGIPDLRPEHRAPDRHLGKRLGAQDGVKGHRQRRGRFDQLLETAQYILMEIAQRTIFKLDIHKVEPRHPRTDIGDLLIRQPHHRPTGGAHHVLVEIENLDVENIREIADKAAGITRNAAQIVVGADNGQPGFWRQGCVFHVRYALSEIPVVAAKKADGRNP